MNIGGYVQATWPAPFVLFDSDLAVESSLESNSMDCGNNVIPVKYETIISQAQTLQFVPTRPVLFVIAGVSVPGSQPQLSAAALHGCSSMLRRTYTPSVPRRTHRALFLISAVMYGLDAGPSHPSTAYQWHTTEACGHALI